MCSIPRVNRVLTSKSKKKVSRVLFPRVHQFLLQVKSIDVAVMTSRVPPGSGESFCAVVAPRVVISERVSSFEKNVLCLDEAFTHLSRVLNFVPLAGRLLPILLL